MSSTAIRAIKAFRLNQIKDLPKHIIRFGALPPSQTAEVPLRLPNPFIPRRNPTTGKWSPPKYSLRRQAELVKLAKEANALYLLPPGPKNPPSSTPQIEVNTSAYPSQAVPRATSNNQAVKPTHKEELGSVCMGPVDWEGEVRIKEVAGAEIGTRLYAAKKRMFKGHKWERAKEGRERKRKILMRDMARRIRNYKSYYKKRRPDPLKPSRSAKASKLPF